MLIIGEKINATIPQHSILSPVNMELTDDKVLDLVIKKLGSNLPKNVEIFKEFKEKGYNWVIINDQKDIVYRAEVVSTMRIGIEQKELVAYEVRFFGTFNIEIKNNIMTHNQFTQLLLEYPSTKYILDKSSEHYKSINLG